MTGKHATDDEVHCVRPSSKREDQSPTSPPTYTHAERTEPNLLWPRIRHSLREPFSEFLGTMVLVLFGDGVVAQVILSNGEKGNYLSICWIWG